MGTNTEFEKGLTNEHVLTVYNMCDNWKLHNNRKKSINIGKKNEVSYIHIWP